MTTTHKEKMAKLIVGSLLEFGPILVFLISFHFLHVYKATLILMFVTIISTIATYRLQKRLPYLALYVALLTTVFGYMTLIHHAPRFIQLRDTLYDVTCALTLSIGLLFNIPFLKYAFSSVISMTTRAWRRLSMVWICFFIINAGLNEYVRRTLSLTDWFDFKAVIVPITIIFGCLALFLVYEKDEPRD